MPSADERPLRYPRGAFGKRRLEPLPELQEAATLAGRR
jgi:hypothetical protein